MVNVYKYTIKKRTIEYRMCLTASTHLGDPIRGMYYTTNCMISTLQYV